MARINSFRTRFVSYCLLLGVCFGCSRYINPDEAIAKVNETNIQRLANLYFSYQMRNDWLGPDDEADFKEFLSKCNPRKLARIGVDPNAIDKLFVNERDGQPFKIRYKVPGSAMGSAEPVVFEAVGVDGKRLVGFLNMVQREVDEAEFDALWAGETENAPLREGTPAEL